MRYAQFVSQALWRPMGAGDAWMWLDREGGAAHADCCMLARQGDWIRLAELLIRLWTEPRPKKKAPAPEPYA